MNDLPQEQQEQEAVTEATATEETPKPKMLWQHFEGGSLLEKLGAIDGIVARGEGDIAFALEIEEEAPGVLEPGGLTVDVTAPEKTMLSVALNVIGFFSDELAVHAESLMAKVKAADVEVNANLSEETRERIEAASVAIQKREFAEMLGIDLEALEGSEDEPEATEEPQVEGSWAAPADSED